MKQVTSLELSGRKQEKGQGLAAKLILNVFDKINTLLLLLSSAQNNNIYLYN